jgi:hypothetical protein
MGSNVHSGSPRWFLTAGLALILIGFVGILVVDARRRARIHYALTSEHVMVVGGSGRGSVQSISLLTLPGLSLIEGGDGCGTVLLGFVSWIGSAGYDKMTVSQTGTGNTAQPQFNRIADARRVYQMIRDAQKRVWEQHPSERPGSQPASAEAVQTDRIPAAIDADLSAGEQVLWSGQPRQGLMLRAMDRLMIPLTLLVTIAGGFLCRLWLDTVIFGKGTPYTEKPGIWVINGLYVLLALLMFYILIGRFFTDARRRAKTHYALTNERVLIACGRGRVLSANLRTLPDLSLTEGRNGYGDIWLASVPLNRAASSGDVFGINTPPYLDTIPDAQRVYQLIRDAQQRARPET